MKKGVGILIGVFFAAIFSIMSVLLIECDSTKTTMFLGVVLWAGPLIIIRPQEKGVESIKFFQLSFRWTLLILPVLLELLRFLGMR